MGMYTVETEWHDLRKDPDDLPAEGEPIIVTVETFFNRETWLDVFYIEESVGEPKFYTKVINEFNQPENQAVWLPVIAWAYPPSPFVAF